MHPSRSPAPTHRLVSYWIPADFYGPAFSEPLQENLQCRDGDLLWLFPLSANSKAVSAHPKAGSGVQKHFHNNLAHPSVLTHLFWVLKAGLIADNEKLRQWVFANSLLCHNSLTSFWDWSPCSKSTEHTPWKKSDRIFTVCVFRIVEGCSSTHCFSSLLESYRGLGSLMHSGMNMVLHVLR